MVKTKVERTSELKERSIEISNLNNRELKKGDSEICGTMTKKKSNICITGLSEGGECEVKDIYLKKQLKIVFKNSTNPNVGRRKKKEERNR